MLDNAFRDRELTRYFLVGQPLNGGAAFGVTLTGTNLTRTSAVTVSGSGVSVSSISVVNSTTVTANFTISGSALRTARAVRVTTPGGNSNTVTFRVQ